MMLLERRIACNLHLDPYTQNASECMNRVIKKDMLGKMALQDFIGHAQQVINRQDAKIEVTASADPRRFHTVNAAAKSGKISCDCLNNQATTLCSHAIAVAIKGDHVSEFVKWFKSSKLEL